MGFFAFGEAATKISFTNWTFLIEPPKTSKCILGGIAPEVYLDVLGGEKTSGEAAKKILFSPSLLS